MFGVAEAERWCHDTGVILGDIMRAACAGADGFTVFSLDPADGAALDNPVLLYSKDVNEEPVVAPAAPIEIGHSAAFNGGLERAGEPVAAGGECETTRPAVVQSEPPTGGPCDRPAKQRTTGRPPLDEVSGRTYVAGIRACGVVARPGREGWSAARSLQILDNLRVLLPVNVATR